MYGKRLAALSLTTIATLTLTLALVFFWAPNDADQGFLQKIIYIHVPLAIITLCVACGSSAAVEHSADDGASSGAGPVSDPTC